LQKETLEEIEAINLHFNEHFLKLDKETINETYKDFLIDFAYNTTSLEGNTITLEEAQRLLTENLTPKNKTLREIYDLQNTEKVFFEILSSKESLSHDLIIKIHDRLMENIDKRKGYRTHDIKVFRSRFDASPGRYVRTDMNLLLNWYQKNKKILHPFVLASIFHQKFEKIHPFGDGNGRTGRILMIYITLRNKYPPFIVSKKRRGEYLDALSEADKTNSTEVHPQHYKKLINFLSDELIISYWNNFLV
jgi:Fic family protein